MTYFNNRQLAHKDCFSPPFYTHKGGYKMCLCVKPDGWWPKLTVNRLSLHAHLMKGEHDNALSWPFHADLTIEVLNWTEDKKHIAGTFSFQGIRTAPCDRVVSGDINPAGWWLPYSNNPSYSSLTFNSSTNTEYLHNGCLRFRLKAVEFYSTPLIPNTPAWQDDNTASKSLCEFTLTEFSKHKQFSNKFYSTPFHSHPKGYKLCLNIFSNGYGTALGNCVSIGLELLKGEFDDNLMWPFKGQAFVELLNWRQDKDHIGGPITLEPILSGPCSRVLEHKIAQLGIVTANFASHSLLYNPTTGTQYLMDDCLRVRVKTIASFENPNIPETPVWETTSQSLCEFTLKEFTKRKELDNIYNSTPFYTHEYGYKLSLQVHANGFGSKKNTHVSVLAGLMMGEYDNQLQWPLECDVFVELINWREDKDHLSQNFGFNKIKIVHSQRVTQGISGQFFGDPQFIPYSSLHSATNAKYIQNDCIRIRVKKVMVYSIPLIPKTLAWQDHNIASNSLFEFTLTEFSKRKEFNNQYFSTPFYTHKNGYKVCLRVDSNGLGDDKDTHMTISASLMMGEHDDQLQWPLECDIIVELINWIEDKGHRSHTFGFNKMDTKYSKRVAENILGRFFGTQQFISHSSLPFNPTTNTEYLKEDCIRFRVKRAEFYSTPLITKTPAWQDGNIASKSLCEFTLTEFSKRKQFNNQYYSTPFYTHENGYKACLAVDTNGYGSAKDTHMSVFACIMIGEHDDQLKWLLECNIIVEMINWREDKGHCTHTFGFNKTKINYSNEITEGIHGEFVHVQQFISHSSLNFNPTTNTEYLQEDCIRFRVKRVEFYSTPLITKTPAWQDHNIASKSPCEFTLTEFSKRKQSNNNYYSTPFYTHENGYKVCLTVNTNGYGSDKDTHMTIFACLMKGEHDNQLLWPFECDIIVELINWREDKHHQSYTFDFNEKLEINCSKKVTEGRFGQFLRSHNFISHSSLSFNPSTNTEYLQEDCIRFRVKVIKFYSAPLINKILLDRTT